MGAEGARAMLARLGPLARHTLDLDLYFQSGDLNEAEAALRVAASSDLGDFFRFELRPGAGLAPGWRRARARRVSVTAFLGVTEFARFHVELGVGVQMTGKPDPVGPLVAN